MPNFGKKSLEVRSSIDPILVLLCDTVIRYFDISLIRGSCGKAEQNNLFAAGLSSFKWPDSNHNVDEFKPYPENLSMAVDVTPWPIPFEWGDLRSRKIKARDIQWKERVKFYQMVAIFKYEWARLQASYFATREYELRFGADWDGDNDFTDQEFDDLVHLELVRKIRT